jgi:hypothetical protein
MAHGHDGVDRREQIGPRGLDVGFERFDALQRNDVLSVGRRQNRRRLIARALRIDGSLPA